MGATAIREFDLNQCILSHLAPCQIIWTAWRKALINYEKTRLEPGFPMQPSATLRA
jgi:hypothetical protein